MKEKQIRSPIDEEGEKYRRRKEKFGHRIMVIMIQKERETDKQKRKSCCGDNELEGKNKDGQGKENSNRSLFNNDKTIFLFA